MTEWVTVSEAAAILGITERAVRKNIAAGKLEARKIRGRGRGGITYLVRLNGHMKRSEPPVEEAVKPLSMAVEPDTSELAHLPEWQRQAALERYHIIRRWESEIKPRIPYRKRRAAFQEYLQEVGWSAGKFYRLSAALRKHGIIGLVPQHGKVRSRKLSPEELELIRAHYLSSNRPSIKDVYEFYIRACSHAGWEPASYSTVARAIRSEISYEEKVWHRLGPKKFEELCVPHILRDPSNLKVMELVVADHRVFDAFVRGPNGKPQRPWLTALMDMRSRMFVGWCVSFSPSGETIAVAIKRMVERYGVPKVLLMDNGLDFKSQRLLGKKRVVSETDERVMGGLLRALGITPIFAWPYHPQSKPIEANFRVIKEKFDRRLRSFCGGSPDEKPHDLKKRLSGKLMSIEEFARLFGAWLDEVWAKRPHGGVGMDNRTPLEVFEAEERYRGVEPISTDALWFIFARKKEVVRQREGIKVFGEWYASDELFALTNIGDRLVVFYTDDTKLDELWVGDESGRVLCKVRCEKRADWLVNVGQYEQRKRREKVLAAKVREGKAAQPALYAEKEAEALGLPDDHIPPDEPPVVNKPRRVSVDLSIYKRKAVGDDYVPLSPDDIRALTQGRAAKASDEPVLLSDYIDWRELVEGGGDEQG